MKPFHQWIQEADELNPGLDPSVHAEAYRQTFGRGPNEDDYRGWAAQAREMNPGVEVPDEVLRQQYTQTYGEPDPAPSDWNNAWADAWSEAKGIGGGLVGLAGQTLGLDGMRDWGMEAYQRNMADVEARQRPQYGIDYLMEDGTLGDWVDAAQYHVTKGIPSLIGGLGAGLIGKAALKQGVKTAVKGATEKTLERAGTAGFLGGVGAYSTGQELGQIYPEAVREMQSRGKTADDVDLAKVYGYGALAGGVETAADVAMLGMAGFTRLAPALTKVTNFTRTGSIPARVAKIAGAGMATEGAEELAQTPLEYLGADRQLGTPEFWAEERQAGFAGILGGLGASVVTAPMNILSTPRIQDGQPTDLTSPPDNTPSVTPDQLGLVPGVGLQQAIDARMGAAPLSGKARKQYEQDLLKAFNEPAGFRVDENQVEQPLTAYEALYRQATGELSPAPTPEAKPEKVSKAQRNRILSMFDDKNMRTSARDPARTADLVRLQRELDQTTFTDLRALDGMLATETARGDVVGSLRAYLINRRRAALQAGLSSVRGELAQNPQALDMAPTPKKVRDAATRQERAQQEWAAKVASVHPVVQDLATSENLPIREITAAEKYWGALQTWDEKRLAAERTKLSDVNSRAPAWKSTLLGLFDDAQAQADVDEATQILQSRAEEALAQSQAPGAQETSTPATGTTTGETVQATQEAQDTGAEPATQIATVGQADNALADIGRRLVANTPNLSEAEAAALGLQFGFDGVPGIEVDPLRRGALTLQEISDALKAAGYTKGKSDTANRETARKTIQRGLNKIRVANSGNRELVKNLISKASALRNEADNLVDDSEQIGALTQQEAVDELNTASTNLTIRSGTGGVNQVGLTTSGDRTQVGSLTDDVEMQARLRQEAEAAAKAEIEFEARVAANPALAQQRQDADVLLPDPAQAQANQALLQARDAKTRERWAMIQSVVPGLSTFDAAPKEVQDTFADFVALAEDAPAQLRQSYYLDAARYLQKEVVGANLAAESAEARGVLPRTEGGAQESPQVPTTVSTSGSAEGTRAGGRAGADVAITTKRRRLPRDTGEPQAQPNDGYQNLGPEAAQAQAQNPEGLSPEIGELKTKYGEAQATQPTTRKAFNQALADLLGRADSWRVHLYDTAEQAAQAGIPENKLGGTSGRGAYGWVETINGKTHATFILDRVEAGTEVGKILHELGAHIGMEGLLSGGQLQALYDKVSGWAALENTSQESKIAQAALARIAQAETPDTQLKSEAIAYFVEEAVKAGVNPTAMSHKGELARWFRQLWAAFKQALRALRVRNIDRLTAQNIVDLAHGAAKLELTGQWHGTPETFRVFNSSAAPLGNASAQGRGTYTTTNEATARDYAQDGGNLLRTDSPIPKDRLLVWNAPISAQPQPVQDALASSGLVSDTSTTGRGVYESARAMLGDKGAADLLDALGIYGTVQGDTTAVFNDKNILTIGRAPGGDLSQIRYGEPGWAPTRVIQENIKKLPGPLQDTTKAIVETAKAAARKTHLGLASTKDLADYISDKAAPFKGVVKEYMANVQAAKIERITRDKVASDILARYHALKLKPVQKSVADFLAKARIEEKWGYDPQVITAANPEAWQPAGYQKGERVTVDPDMAAAFGRLTPAAQRVVVDINKTLSDNFRTTQELIEKNVVDVYDKRIAQTDEALAAATDAKVIKRLEKRLASLKADKESTLKSYGKRLIATKAPYAPLKRDGKYVVQAHSNELKTLYDKGENRTAEENKRYNTLRRDENHYRLEFVNSRFEIEQRKRVLAETFGENVDAWEKTSWRENTFVGLPEIDRLRSLVQEGVVDDSAAKLSRAVEKLALQVMVDTHARQSQHQAKKIPGYDPDMVRSFISQARADAHNLANLKYLSEINDSIQRMTRMVEDKDVRAQTDLTRDELGNMVSELHQRWGDTLKYQPSPVVDRLAAFSSTWHLLLSPAYYFQNATQVGMMSVPWMAGTHGWTKTQQAVLRAYRDILPMVKDKAASWEHFNTELVPEDVRAVIKSLELSGQINIFMDLELGQAAATGDGVGAKVGRTFDQTVRRLPAKMETINRVVTAIAAYRLAMEKENNVAKATEYAGKVIDITHGDYDGFNTPRWISPGKWGPTAKLVFQFRKFQLIQLAFYVRMLNDMTAGHPPEVRKAAAKALGFSLAHTTAMAGTLGLPGLMAAQFLASLLGGGDDDPDDKDAQDFRLRKALIDGGMSPGLVDVVLGGLPTLVGVDMTGKLGAQTLLSPLPYTEIAPRQRGNFQTIVADSLGPTVGLADKFYRAFGDFQRGDYYAALEKALPMGIGGDTVQAIRLMDKGERTYNSDQAFSPEELGLATAIVAGLGFTPEILSKRWTKLRVQKSYEGTFDQRTTDIKRAYSAAVNDGSRKDVRRLRQEWLDLQKAKKEAGFRPAPLAELVKAPMEQRKRERQTLGGVKYDRGNRRFVEETNRVIGG